MSKVMITIFFIGTLPFCERKERLIIPPIPVAKVANATNGITPIRVISEEVGLKQPSVTSLSAALNNQSPRENNSPAQHPRLSDPKTTYQPAPTKESRNSENQQTSATPKLDGVESLKVSQLLAAKFAASEKPEFTTSEKPAAKHSTPNACEEGDAEACHEMGWLAQKNKNPSRARKYYLIGCNAGISKSCNNLGFLEESSGNFQKAAAYYLTACMAGHPSACANSSRLDSVKSTAH